MAGIAAAEKSPSRGKWLVSTALVVLAALVMVGLGYWQLQRLDQRRAHNAFLLSRLRQSPALIDGGAVDPAALDTRRGIVRGTYDFQQEILLRNRALNGVPGVHMITPLRIDGSDMAVLVDRGWIPFEQAAPEARAAFDQPAGPVEIHGLIHPSQTRPNGLSPADPPLTAARPRLDEWFRVDIPRIQQQVPYTLLPVFVEEGEIDARGVSLLQPADRLPRPDIEIDLSNGPHLGYAIQWFSFAGILLVGYGALFRRRTRS